MQHLHQTKKNIKKVLVNKLFSQNKFQKKNVHLKNASVLFTYKNSVQCSWWWWWWCRNTFLCYFINSKHDMIVVHFLLPKAIPFANLIYIEWMICRMVFKWTMCRKKITNKFRKASKTNFRIFCLCVIILKLE